MASARYPEFRKGRASNRNFFGFSGRAWKHTPRDFSVELGETLFGRFRMSSDLFFPSSDGKFREIAIGCASLLFNMIRHVHVLVGGTARGPL